MWSSTLSSPSEAYKLYGDCLIKVCLESKKSGFRQLHDVLPQGSIFAPLLFYIHTVEFKQLEISHIPMLLLDHSIDTHVTDPFLHLTLMPSKTVSLNGSFEKPNPCFSFINRMASYEFDILFDGDHHTHNEYPQWIVIRGNSS